MSIFRRQELADVKQPSAAPSPEAGAPGVKPAQATKLTPPFASPRVGAAGAAAPGTAARGAAAAVAAPAPSSLPPRGAPGVVPPPAAPVYSMRPPESATRVEIAAEIEKAQESVQKRVRVALARTRTAAPPATGVRRSQPIPVTSWAAQPRARQPFDPVRATQAGLLNLAWSWQQAGSPIRAIHAYMQVLSRYPDTPGAAAAVADLVELSDKLVEQGQFHMALGIYDQLEELLPGAPCE
jgi:tetratricopeptide (TPR) repeat protein